MICTLLMLASCGKSGADDCSAVQARWSAAESCAMTADVECLGDEAQKYELSCEWKNGGESSVTVEAPDELAGITARFDGEDMSLVFDGAALAAGKIGSGELSPASCLPRLADAVCGGYMLEKSREKRNGEETLRIVFDTTGKNGEKVDCTVWFRDDATPVAAEISEGGSMIFKGEFTAFEFGDTISDNNS
jgi:hypothetical protein